MPRHTITSIQLRLLIVAIPAVWSIPAMLQNVPPAQLVHMPTTKTVEKPQEIYQIKLRLLGTDPPIWRRLWFPQT